MNCKNITKYLTQYAEKKVLDVAELMVKQFEPLSIFQHVVVIPAYKESPAFIERFLNSKCAHQHVLLIVIINQPDTEINTQPQRNLADFIKRLGDCSAINDELHLVSIKHKASILMIDAFSQAIPTDQGVGLARKLGADTALLLISQGVIDTAWIHSTDADAYLPDDYFTATDELTQCDDAKKIAAASYNFSHFSNDAKLESANKRYESALRYYVSGLHYAGSDYDFFTIGSVIAFKAEQYATVRGFPKRSAGEDFYLLNKLAKLGRIEFIRDQVVRLDARESDRVPFGTGPSVSHILQLDEDNKAYCYYHPQVFNELKACLVHFSVLWEKRFDLTSWLTCLSVESQQALADIKLMSFVDKQKNNNKVQFNKQLLVWFDAFKTLKFIHSLRAQKYADIPLKQAIELAAFPIKF